MSQFESNSVSLSTGICMLTNFQLSVKRETTHAFICRRFNIITLQITCVWSMIQTILPSHQSCQEWMNVASDRRME